MALKLVQRRADPFRSSIHVQSLEPGNFPLQIGQFLRAGARCLLRGQPIIEARAAGPCPTEHRDHQKDAEQEEREGRDKFCSLAMDIASRQFSRPPCQQRQGAPDLPVKMKYAMGNVVRKFPKRAMHDSLLPAGAAIGPAQHCPTVAAGATGGLPALPRVRLHRAGKQPARRQISQGVDISRHRGTIAVERSLVALFCVFMGALLPPG